VTLEGMGIPHHLAGHDAPRVFEVRASRVEIAGRHLRSELWIGGGYTAFGRPVGPEDLGGAWIVDCAGDLPGEFATVARLYLPRVFEDIEQTPSRYTELDALARELAAAIDASLEIPGSAPGRLLPAEPPERLYIMCKQGLNRSGLVVGRVLRALGLSGDEALRTLRAHRPGALANLAFERLMHD
jgi:hypothetical protein